MVLIGSTTIATNGSWNIAFIFSVLGTWKTIFRPGSFGWASVWKHQFPRANIRNQGESDTNQWHSRGDQPKSSMSTRFKYSSYLFGRLNVGSHVLVTLRLSIHPCLCSFHWQGKGVHHHHDISVHLKLKFYWREEKKQTDLSQQQSHDLKIAPRSCMHNHFQQSQSRDLDVLQMQAAG